MAISSSIPFSRSSSSSTALVARDGSNRRLALDNLIRRELKVGDPNDPAQVAQALLTRYQADPRAQGINQEAQGLPFLLMLDRAAAGSAGAHFVERGVAASHVGYRERSGGTHH